MFSVSMLLAYVRRVFFLLLQRACESWLGPGGQGWGCWGMEGGGGCDSRRVRIRVQRLAALRCFFVQWEVRGFRSSLAGARGGQVVAVLVLGPKPQPLLVLLLWFFGSLLP